MMPAHTVSYHDLYFKLTCDYAAAAIPVAGGPDVMLQMQSTRCSGVSARAGLRLAGSVAAAGSSAAAQAWRSGFPERPKKIVKKSGGADDRATTFFITTLNLFQGF